MFSLSEEPTSKTSLPCAPLSSNQWFIRFASAANTPRSLPLVKCAISFLLRPCSQNRIFLPINTLQPTKPQTMKTNYASMADRIRACKTLDQTKHAEVSLNRLWDAGVFTKSEMQRLDVLICDQRNHIPQISECKPVRVTVSFMHGSPSNPHKAYRYGSLVGAVDRNHKVLVALDGDNTVISVSIGNVSAV